MAALLLPLDDLFAALSPAPPAWILPLVFAGITVSVTKLLERHPQLAGLAAPPLPTNRPPTPLPAGAARHSDSLPVVPALVAIDLRAELVELVTQVQPAADATSVRLELAIPPGLAVRADPAGLRPVLQALLSNAVERTPGGTVFVGAMRADGFVRLIMIDDGRTGARPIPASLRKPMARLLARAGAGLVVDHRSGNGTTLVLSLPEAG